MSPAGPRRAGSASASDWAAREPGTRPARRPRRRACCGPASTSGQCLPAGQDGMRLAGLGRAGQGGTVRSLQLSRPAQPWQLRGRSLLTRPLLTRTADTTTADPSAPRPVRLSARRTASSRSSAPLWRGWTTSSNGAAGSGPPDSAWPSPSPLAVASAAARPELALQPSAHAEPPWRAAVRAAGLRCAVPSGLHSSSWCSRRDAEGGPDAGGHAAALRASARRSPPHSSSAAACRAMRAGTCLTRVRSGQLFVGCAEERLTEPRRDTSISSRSARGTVPYKRTRRFTASSRSPQRPSACLAQKPRSSASTRTRQPGGTQLAPSHPVTSVAFSDCSVHSTVSCGRQVDLPGPSLCRVGSLPD